MKRSTFIYLLFLLNSCLLMATSETFAQRSKKKGSVTFKKHVILPRFISEGVAVGDVNKDGKSDIIAGAYWFEAPDWKQHTITKADSFDAVKGYSNSFLNFMLDINHDGRLDLIRVGLPGREAVWYENPGNSESLWKEHPLYPTVGNESPMFVDVDGDGREDLVCSNYKKKKMVWVQAPLTAADTTWKEFPFSTDTVIGVWKSTLHGMGYEDMNGDGRKDILVKEGWWEAPVNRKQPGWTFHHADFGEDCAQMYTMDVDRDGDLDVISSSAHRYGIWWHEQTKNDSGKVLWKHHTMDSSFSQSHGLALVDLNRDGYPDLVTGKRFLAHIRGDPGDWDPSVLVWYEYKRGKKPSWTRHALDDNSGVGLHLVTQDITGDKLTDLIISNKKGVFLYEQVK